MEQAPFHDTPGAPNTSTNPVNNATDVVDAYLSVQVAPHVDVLLEMEEFVDHTTSKAEKAIAQFEMPVTEFPKWVRMFLVNKIRSLACFEAVRDLVLQGEGSTSVAAWIQAHGEMVDKNPDYIRQCVEHYKATIPRWAFAMRHQPKKYLELQQESEKTIDTLKEMAKLYRWMEQRLEIVMGNERKFGLLTQGAEKNFVVAAHLLEKIQELREKAGLANDRDGVMQSAQKQFAHSSIDTMDWDRVYGRESVSKVLQNPESRTRVIRVVERFMDLYGSKMTIEDLDRMERKQAVKPDPDQPLPNKT